LPDEAYPGLHSKPLDAAIEQVLASNRRGGAARQCHGGSSLAAAAAAVAAQRRCTARWQQAMDGARARAMAIDGTGQEGGTMRGWREAM